MACSIGSLSLEASCAHAGVDHYAFKFFNIAEEIVLILDAQKGTHARPDNVRIPDKLR